MLTNGAGEVIDTFCYGTYGEVIDGDTSLTRFLYNGGEGVSTDDTGLYYMRARYYNVAIRRFINQDVLVGVASDPVSLNRYAYVNGNQATPVGIASDKIEDFGRYKSFRRKHTLELV